MNLQKLKKVLSKYPKLYTALSWSKLIYKSIRIRFLMFIFRICKVKKNKVMIISYYGKGYGDNAKYIVNEILKYKSEIDVYWAIQDKYLSSLPNNIKHCKYNSISYFYHLATAGFWINNSRFPYGVMKRKGQFYIQTWHSSLRLKKIEKDAEKSLNPIVIKNSKKDSKMIDLIVSGCKFSTNIYKNSFWYDGIVSECGTPRCDIFFDMNKKKIIRKKIYKKYGIDKLKKIILYAPTFRKTMNEKDIYLNIENFAKKIEKNYVLLVRFHPISKYTIRGGENVINVTNYDDMQELLCASDFLITDYSGCCFDMMINKKPCILLTKDLDDYLKKERNLYFKFEELPFTNCDNEDKLLDEINNFNYDEYYEKVRKFSKKIGLCEMGKASKYIYELIEGRLK